MQLDVAYGPPWLYLNYSINNCKQALHVDENFMDRSSMKHYQHCWIYLYIEVLVKKNTEMYKHVTWQLFSHANRCMGIENASNHNIILKFWCIGKAYKLSKKMVDTYIFYTFWKYI